MKKFIVLFIFCFLNNFAQNNLFESEAIFLHTNSTTLVTGEKLLYKIYCLNASTKEISTISKVAYVEIINNQGESVSRNKIGLNNGIGANEIFINTNFNTGNYKLIAYTNWMLNNSSAQYFETEITIINPFLPFKNSTTDSENKYIDNSKITTNSEKINEVIFQNNKKSYLKREQVSLNILDNTEKFKNGNYSISVRKIDELNFNKNQTSTTFSQTKLDEFVTENSISYLPEIRGEILSGKIISPNGSKEIKNQHIALSVVGEPFDFKIVKTNVNGEFYFTLEKDINQSNIQLQLIENNITDFQISIQPKAKITINSEFSKLHLTEKNIKPIEDRLIASQIVNAYANVDSLIVDKSNKYPFYKYATKEYILDDFKRFPSFKETIIEIIPDVYFKKNNDYYSLHIKDYITGGESFGSALVLVDGLMLQDVSELFEYNTKNIYKFNVINKAYSYGSKIFSGVIAISTFSKMYESKSNLILPLTIERCKEQIRFSNKVYDPNLDFNRIPDYRYQLAWETNLKLEKNNTSLSFFTSDMEGVYEINLEGFSKDGQPLSLKEYFEVK